jgi:hypothetical protein
VTFNVDTDGNLEVEIEIQGFPNYRGNWEIKRNQPVVSVEDRVRHTKWRSDLQQMMDVGEYFLQNFDAYFSVEDRENLKSLIAKGRDAISREDRAAGNSIGNGISLALMGSGTASDLFLAQRVQEMADKNVAREIARARVALERAYKEKNEKQIREISDALKLAIHRVLDVEESGRIAGPPPGALTG